MSKNIVSLLLFIPSLLLGQATKKVTNKDTKEIYYVLKLDKSIREGSYKKAGWEGKPMIDGFYKNGIKDSIWTFYDFYGQIEQKYDYTKKVLVFEIQSHTDKPEKSKVLKGSDTIEAVLDQFPIYIGGGNVLNQFISDSIQYPEAAKDSTIMGTVQIGFTVTANGYAINYRVIKAVYPCLDKEALRVAKLIPGEWVPGVLNGEKVDVPLILPIRFILR